MFLAMNWRKKFSCSEIGCTLTIDVVLFIHLFFLLPCLSCLRSDLFPGAESACIWFTP